MRVELIVRLLRWGLLALVVPISKGEWAGDRAVFDGCRLLLGVEQAFAERDPSCSSLTNRAPASSPSRVEEPSSSTGAGYF